MKLYTRWYTNVFFMERALERYVTQFLDYLGLRIKIPKIDCTRRKRSHVKVIAPRAEVTPFPVVVTQLDYDAVPVGGSYWFNGQLQKRYWAATTPTAATPIVGSDRGAENSGQPIHHARQYLGFIAQFLKRNFARCRLLELNRWYAP